MMVREISVALRRLIKRGTTLVKAPLCVLNMCYWDLSSTPGHAQLLTVLATLFVVKKTSQTIFQYMPILLENNFYSQQLL